MSTIIFCRGDNAPADQSWPTADLNLTAALATGDPAADQSSEGFAGRLIATGREPAVVAGSMDSEPGIWTPWTAVDVYTASNAYGQWAPEPVRQRELFQALAPDMEPPLGGAAIYAVFCAGGASPEATPEQRLAHGRYIARLWPRMMLGVQLDHLRSRGGGTPPTPWRALYVFTAESLAAAVRLGEEDPFAREGVWSASTFALRAARGAWVEAGRQ